MQHLIDSLSTAALRLMIGADESHPSGSFITTTDHLGLRELNDAGFSFPAEPIPQGYRSTLTTPGERILRKLRPEV